MHIILADNHGQVLGKDQATPNLSLLYLGSYLRSQIPDVGLTYISQIHPPEYHLNMIRQLQPTFYAVSFTSFSALRTFQLVRAIKSLFPWLKVICGGPHSMTHSEQILRESGADVCVIGEGEVTFSELVKHHAEFPEVLESIQGIAFLQNGHYQRTENRALIADLNTVPFPARDLVNDSEFAGVSYRKGTPTTEMVITRGCPLRCVFCANPVYRLKNGPLFRSRTPQNIAAEVEELYAMGYREIFLHSDELNVELGWSIDVCKALAELGHSDLYFQANLRVIPISEEFVYWLKKANFWFVRIGMESASDRVLTGIKKKMSLENTERACNLLSKQGIKIFAYFMLFNWWEEDGCLTHETADEVRSTIRLGYRLWRQNKLHYCSWTLATPIQGAEFYDLALKHGLIDEQFLPPEDMWPAYKYLSEVSKREFNSLYARARRQQALMALTGGHIEWRNWRGIARRAMGMFRGMPESNNTITEYNNQSISSVSGYGTAPPPVFAMNYGSTGEELVQIDRKPSSLHHHAHKQ
jgi:anaerobic magnesium-protoporphyrin IX monomethyl ester cyclase